MFTFTGSIMDDGGGDIPAAAEGIAKCDGTGDGFICATDG
jgi:hypothetical protein